MHNKTIQKCQTQPNRTSQDTSVNCHQQDNTAVLMSARETDYHITAPLTSLGAFCPPSSTRGTGTICRFSRNGTVPAPVWVKAEESAMEEFGTGPPPPGPQHVGSTSIGTVSGSEKFSSLRFGSEPVLHGIGTCTTPD